MPIRGFLSNQAFEPETIREMSLALEDVCDALGLRLTEDPAVRPIAERIIELARRGVRDAPTLRAITLKDFSCEAAQANAG
jgi:hypothetical protein